MSDKLNEERVFMEQIMNDRFNFFLVFFSIIVAGAATTQQQLFFQIILTMGFFISFCLALTIHRAFLKQDRLIERIFKNRKTHPATWVENKLKKEKMKGLFSVRFILGWLIPISCTLFLFFGAVLAWLNVLKVIP